MAEGFGAPAIFLGRRRDRPWLSIDKPDGLGPSLAKAYIESGKPKAQP
jgi:hypothetical protein